MQTQETAVTDVQISLARSEPRLREAALGVVAALLGVVFFLLLAADQAQVVAGAF